MKNNDDLGDALRGMTAKRHTAIAEHDQLRETKPFKDSTRRIKTLLSHYGVSVNAIAFMAMRSPTYRSSRLSVRILDVLLESAIATGSLIGNGLLNSARREMRFLLEASVKAWWCDTVEPGGPIETKVEFLDDLGKAIGRAHV